MELQVENLLGRYKESLPMYLMAVRLDPVSTSAIWNYMLTLISRNRLADADRERKKLAAIDPKLQAHHRDDDADRRQRHADSQGGHRPRGDGSAPKPKKTVTNTLVHMTPTLGCLCRLGQCAGKIATVIRLGGT